MNLSNRAAFVPAFFSNTKHYSYRAPFPKLVFHSSRALRPLLHVPRQHTIRAETEQPERSSPIPGFQLTPPNGEVDWIVVDVLVQETEEDRLPLYATGDPFIESVQEDAKSLVRVLLRDAPAEMSVVLCTDKYIQSINKQWRGKDSATDVLSFPQNDPDQVVLGDIVISVETAFEQAKQRSIDFKDEVRILLVHGALHLLGYDHEGKKEGDWLLMAQMENKLIKQLQWKGEGLVSEAQDPLYRDIVQP